MKVTEHINRADKTLLSFEILPPLKGKSIHNIYEVLDQLIDVNPAFINVTYHRSEYIYKKEVMIDLTKYLSGNVPALLEFVQLYNLNTKLTLLRISFVEDLQKRILKMH